MEQKAMSREMTEVTPVVHDIEQVSTELYKVGAFITAASAAMVGIWGLVCLSSAMISTGGPVALLKSMFGAL